MEAPSTRAPYNWTKIVTTTVKSPQVPKEESADLVFYLSVVTPLVFCCFAILLCALNSVWKTRKKLEELNKVAKPEPSEYTEFTIDLTTKVDSCVELSSVQESVLL